jgi:hypothetical protein
VNQFSIACDKGFACCLSEEIFNECKFNSSIESHEFSIPQDNFKCFISLLEIAKGYSFAFEKFDSRIVSSTLDILNFSSAKQALMLSIPVPETIRDSSHFLQKSDCYLFASQYEASISFFAKRFSEIDLKLIISLSIHVLGDILSSPLLKVRSENWLFLFIFRFIK